MHDRSSLAIADAAPSTLTLIGREDARGRYRLELVGPGRLDGAVIEERIRGPRRIRAVLDAMVRERARGVVRTSGGPRVVTATRLDEAAMTWAAPGGQPPCEPLGVIEVVGYNSVFHIAVDDVRAPIPDEIIRIRRRRLRRVPAPPGLSAGELTIVDLSHAGVGFLADRLPRDRFELDVDGIGLYGTLRHSAGVRCGASVVPRSVVDALRWRALVDRVSYPTTRIGAAFDDAIWQLFERAGYFDLSGLSPERFADHRRAFATAGERLDAAPHVGARVVWPTGTDVAATFAIARPYSSTWFAYQMAKVSGQARDGTPGRSVLRELNLGAYERMLGDPTARWVMYQVQDRPVWTRSVHVELAHHYVATGLVEVSRFRPIALRCDVAAVARHDVGPGTDLEIAGLARVIERRRSRPYVEALDLVAERFDLAAVRTTWSCAGLARDRGVIVARTGDRAVAAIVVELAGDGVHLYGLLDCARLFALEPDGVARFPDLLDAAGRWYLERGKAEYVLVVEPDTGLDPADVPGATDLGAADMVILPIELVPELLEFLCEMTAPRT